MRFARRGLAHLTRIVLAVGAVAVLAAALLTLVKRPLDGVEGDVLFEAARMRSRLPLYVDPLTGTPDAVPSRFYVLYPPIWSGFLSIVPAGAAAIVARVLSLVAGYGAFVVVAMTAPRPIPRPVGLAFLFAVSFAPAMAFVAAGRPDGVALFFAALGFASALNAGELRAFGGACFAIAALVKPNVIGLALGTFLVALFVARAAFVRALAAAVALVAIVFAGLWALTNDAFLEHLLRSTAQPLSVDLWTEQLALRLPFVAAPITIAIAYAWSVGDDVRVRFALGALATSLAWAIFCLAKIGSASNYWLEPSVAALGLVAVAHSARVARGQAAFAPGVAGVLVAALLFGQSLWNGVAAVRGSLEKRSSANELHASLARVAERCARAPGQVVIADEPGLEMELDGRLIGTPFQMTNLFAMKRLSRGPWIADLDRPEVRCVVAQRDELEGELYPPQHRRFDPEIRAAIRERFTRVLKDEAPGLWVYERK